MNPSKRVATLVLQIAVLLFMMAAPASEAASAESTIAGTTESAVKGVARRRGSPKSQTNQRQNVLQISAATEGMNGTVGDAAGVLPQAPGYPSALLPDVQPLSEYLQDGPPLPTERYDLNMLGIEVEDGSERFDGQDVWGAEVVNVRPASPGAQAGLEGPRAALNTFLRTVTFASTLVFLPSAFALQYVEDNHVGDWHDLIIGADGKRVRNVYDLENAVGQMKSGDIVYLNVLRSGKRLLIPVSLATMISP